MGSQGGEPFFAVTVFRVTALQCGNPPAWALQRRVYGDRDIATMALRRLGRLQRLRRLPACINRGHRSTRGEPFQLTACRPAACATGAEFTQLRVEFTPRASEFFENQFHCTRDHACTCFASGLHATSHKRLAVHLCPYTHACTPPMSGGDGLPPSSSGIAGGLRRPVNNTRGKPLVLTVACATWGKPR